MVIAHNMTAANANRMLGLTSSCIAKSSEKLASGYRINRAADDAAGLAISEKMRAQIRGLNRASKNAMDGISLIQTAEGALNEVHAMLHRMNELATQGANDTNTDIDRRQIQKEIDQLKSEIDDVSNKTNFNTKQVLAGINKYKDDGTVDHDAIGEPGKLSYHNAKQNLDGYIDGISYDEVTGTVDVDLNAWGSDVDLSGTWGMFAPYMIPDYDQAKGDNTKYNYMGIDYYPVKGGPVETVQYIPYSFGIDGTNNYYSPNEIVNIIRQLDPDEASKYSNTLDDVFNKIVDGHPDDIKSVNTLVKNGKNTLEIKAWSDVNEPNKYMLQVGAQSGQGIEISIDHMNARRLGITGCRVTDFEKAGKAMQSIQDAIDIVSSVRSDLGAQQNRLEHTIANLDNTAENISASESRIRDTDMAMGMVEFTKSKLLEQVGQAILAQANTSTQGVLSLLA